MIDRLFPVRDVAMATPGEVIEALEANRLTAPAPLVHVEDWARAVPVTEVFGLDAEALNDDRIGRALETRSPRISTRSRLSRARALSGIRHRRLASALGSDLGLPGGRLRHH